MSHRRVHRPRPCFVKSLGVDLCRDPPGSRSNPADQRECASQYSIVCSSVLTFRHGGTSESKLPNFRRSRTLRASAIGGGNMIMHEVVWIRSCSNGELPFPLEFRRGYPPRFFGKVKEQPLRFCRATPKIAAVVKHRKAPKIQTYQGICLPQLFEARQEKSPEAVTRARLVRAQHQPQTTFRTKR